MLQSTGTCTGYYVFGTESNTFSWASGPDKAACLLPLYVIFMDLTSRRSRGLQSVQFGAIRVPPLLLCDDVDHEVSTDCHFWCALKQFAVWRSQEEEQHHKVWGYCTLWIHMGHVSFAAPVVAPQSLQSIVDTRRLQSYLGRRAYSIQFVTWIWNLTNNKSN